MIDILLGEWRFLCQADMTSFGYRVILVRKIESGTEYFNLKTGTGTLVKAGEMYEGDIPILPQEHLQAMANGLYEAGFKPQCRRFQEEQDLLKSHLEDMRRLVFKDNS